MAKSSVSAQKQIMDGYFEKKNDLFVVSDTL